MLLGLTEFGDFVPNDQSSYFTESEHYSLANVVVHRRFTNSFQSDSKHKVDNWFRHMSAEASCVEQECLQIDIVG